MVGAGSRARRPLLALAVAVGIALAAAPTLAHHSRAMFDMGKNITYRGVVEEYRWQNPHSHIVVRVGAGAADRSTVGTWTVEASAISVMTSSGMDGPRPLEVDDEKSYDMGGGIALILAIVFIPILLIDFVAMIWAR